jgi:hypothetical protein
MTSRICEGLVGKKGLVVGGEIGMHDSVCEEVSRFHNYMSEGLAVTDCFSLSLSSPESVKGSRDVLDDGAGRGMADLSSQLRRIWNHRIALLSTAVVVFMALVRLIGG